ncbi:MAG: efflux RND transporter permease subunit [Myxococcota bacterium]
MVKLKPKSTLDKLIAFSLQYKLVVFLLATLLFFWGISVAPFDYGISFIPRNSVNVDAIPDIGENQQIVFTKWAGRSPNEIEEQITYPLSQLLLGIPGVKTVRGASMFGFSSIYVIFEEGVEFFWSRSRLLEKLNSLPPGLLPSDVKPSLGPPATALGQVFWYTIEGRDKQGKAVGGWDLNELRTIQDYQIKYGLQAVSGVAEVASIGGFKEEIHVEINPDLLQKFGLSNRDIAKTINNSNLNVGARTLEINQVEYMLRGVGEIEEIDDVRNAIIKYVEGKAIRVKDVARVSPGPALRRGLLDKGGAEVVGGVVIIQQNANAKETIARVKQKIAKLSPGLPSKKLNDGRLSKLEIIPFYDRTQLINETVETLNHTLEHEIFITIIVIMILLGHLKTSLLISGILPLGVLFSFILMKLGGVQSNILSLSGIAIAIGTMVDVGIVITENIIRRHKENKNKDQELEVTIFKAVSEVAPAVITSISTTIVSFLPVFVMIGTEGKLFRPLAFTKTFALLSSLIIALFLIPPLSIFVLKKTKSKNHALKQYLLQAILFFLAIVLLYFHWFLGLLGLAVVGLRLYGTTGKYPRIITTLTNLTVALGAIFLLSRLWIPLGFGRTNFDNFLFTVIMMAVVLSVFVIYHHFYQQLLNYFIKHRFFFTLIFLTILFTGLLIWQGYDNLSQAAGFDPSGSNSISRLKKNFPGISKEFMPPLDEGSFLLMPTVMPHSSIGEVKDFLGKQDMSIQNIHEVKQVVGKLGRAETPLDPAPISMIETIINYYPRYYRNSEGEVVKFKYNSNEVDFFRDFNGHQVLAPDGHPYRVTGKYIRTKEGHLIKDKNGRAFPLWRPPLDPELNPKRSAWDGINNPDDIWNEIVSAARIPGITSAPKLQPISTRIVMLQSGIKAAMGIKVFGPTVEDVEEVITKLEAIIKKVETVNSESVSSDRIVSKPYLEIRPKPEALARYGINTRILMENFETATGGKKVATVIRDFERIPVRIRYMRDFRHSPAALNNLLIPLGQERYLPLSTLATISYVKGPQVIKSENSSKVGAVTFGGKDGYSEIEVVQAVLTQIKKEIDNKQLQLPSGSSYEPAGNFKNHQRFQRRLKIIIPLSLVVIFLIIYLQFRSIITAFLIFSGIALAWSGGFIMIWLYGQSWFLDFSFMDVEIRQFMQVQDINLSVAVWVGFLALFGIATDDGVVMATYISQKFAKNKPNSVEQIRKNTVAAGMKRIRATLMTTATTILALVPVLSSHTRGSDVMVPMAVPVFGGMVFEIFTTLVVPVYYSFFEELKLKLSRKLN